MQRACAVRMSSMAGRQLALRLRPGVDGVESLGVGVESVAHPLRQVAVVEPGRGDRAADVDEILQAMLVVPTKNYIRTNEWCRPPK